jgi:50S ribosomal subunit-associated GTPase HflX
VAIARQWHSKHISTATATDPTIEDVMLSMRPMLWLYNKDQLEKRVSQQSVRGRSQWLVVLSCIVSSCYLSITSELTQDFMCTVVVVIF